MFDAAAMSGMITSLKAAAELTQIAINARDAGIVRAKVIELQGQIVTAQTCAMAAQADHSTMLNLVGELEKQVADLKAWDAEKQKYHLTKVAPTSEVLAYTLKEGGGVSEPRHYLCPNCYQDRIKSILQPETRMPYTAKVLVCQRCGSDLYVHGHWRPEHSSRKSPSKRSTR
jgi:hypothetical protein